MTKFRSRPQILERTVIVVSLPVVVPVVGVHFVARLFLGDPLVGLRDLLDLLGQLESDVLESGWLGAVHD